MSSDGPGVLTVRGAWSGQPDRDDCDRKTMKTLLTIFTLALLSLPSLRAEETAPEIELKNKSDFTMDASGRNPFWPIGFKPAAKVNTSQHAGGDVQAGNFLVSSITFDNGGRFAIINGKSMQVGQQFGLQMGTQTYQITVKAIEDGRVILGRRDEEIIVPLRRK